jgi:hypothetical protein
VACLLPTPEFVCYSEGRKVLADLHWKHEKVSPLEFAEAHQDRQWQRFRERYLNVRKIDEAFIEQLAESLPCEKSRTFLQEVFALHRDMGMPRHYQSIANAVFFAKIDIERIRNNIPPAPPRLPCQILNFPARQ